MFTFRARSDLMVQRQILRSSLSSKVLTFKFTSGVTVNVEESFTKRKWFLIIDDILVPASLTNEHALTKANYCKKNVS